MSVHHPVLETPAVMSGLDDRIIAAAELLHDSIAGACVDGDVVHLVARLCVDVAQTSGPALTMRLAGAAQLATENTTPGRSELARRLVDERFGTVTRG